jgi:hypothetical protein
VEFIAEHGWRFLPDYRFDAHTGLWWHRAGVGRQPFDLPDLRWGPGLPGPTEPDRVGPDFDPMGYLRQARELADRIEVGPEFYTPARLSADFDRLRWFELPAACVADSEEG